MPETLHDKNIPLPEDELIELRQMIYERRAMSRLMKKLTILLGLIISAVTVIELVGSSFFKWIRG